MKKEDINFEDKRITDGFAASEQYLEELESSIFEKLDLEKSFEARVDGMTASDTYFKNLESDLMQKVGLSDNVKRSKINQVFQRPENRKYWLAAASVAAIAVFLFTFPDSSEPSDVDFASLTPQTINWYLEENALFLTDADLSVMLRDEVYNIEIEDVEVEKELESYLLDNGIKPYDY